MNNVLDVNSLFPIRQKKPSFLPMNELEIALDFDEFERIGWWAESTSGAIRTRHKSHAFISLLKLIEASILYDKIIAIDHALDQSRKCG